MHYATRAHIATSLCDKYSLLRYKSVHLNFLAKQTSDQLHRKESSKAWRARCGKVLSLMRWKLYLTLFAGHVDLWFCQNGWARRLKFIMDANGFRSRLLRTWLAIVWASSRPHEQSLPTRVHFCDSVNLENDQCVHRRIRSCVLYLLYLKSALKKSPISLPF